MSATQPTFDQWCIIELFGHQRIAGRVTEQTVGGCAFLRVDVPEVDGFPAFTKFYTQGAIYCMTPTDEPTAIAGIKSLRIRPVAEFILPAARQLTFGQPDPDPDAMAGDVDDDDDDDDDRMPF